jgi:polyisoprenoid-binding protein YceI
MGRRFRSEVLLSLAAIALTANSAIAQPSLSTGAALVNITEGTVSFEVGTNVFGTTVRGKSNALKARAGVRDGASGLRVERLEASVPVTSLKTGIGLRDRHMLQYIFRTESGQLPDVRFVADQAECQRDVREVYACVASGLLTIRTNSQPFAIRLEVTPDRSGYRVRGEGRIALSAYGIERPSQFGVTTDDEVRIHVDFAARAGAAADVQRP